MASRVLSNLNVLILSSIASIKTLRRKVGYLGTALSALALLALVPHPTAAAEVTCIQAVNKVVKKKVVTQLRRVKRPTKCKTRGA